ncbi:hypothetical protein SAMN04490239_0607 [Rhodococcus koreensis]|uniref:Uncharacterized protein n=1 Tax=Rhodococcus koreensis TaxID=99653 RepID=A0A1H4IFR3_9NOCA|nr:hypothetical protein SAMN04490239_0607 [Rhodococcus koreensis]
MSQALRLIELLTSQSHTLAWTVPFTSVAFHQPGAVTSKPLCAERFPFASD